MLIKLYLIAYNACCIAGWVQCARYMVEASVKDVTSGQLWNESLGPVLTYVQTAAILEIFHSLFRFVRSPLVPTTIQVASRIVVLWGFTKVSTDAQTDVTSLTLMVLSWSAVEIIRYNFYFLQLLLGKENVPYALFWLRYSAFMLLYPSGISGELLQITSARADAESWPKGTVLDRMSFVLLLSYVPLGPYMIMNMWNNRKRALKRGLKKRPPRPAAGVSWPLVAGKKGKDPKRSTTATNRAIWAAAIGAVSQDLAKLVLKEKNWRFGYTKHAVALVRASCASRDVAVSVAKAGLAEAYRQFQFIRDGKEIPLGAAMDRPNTTDGKFETFTIQGKGTRAKTLKVPYGGSDPTKPYYTYKNVDTVLEGDALKTQLKKWVAYGTIEQSAADAILECVENPKLMDLSDRYFVLLGATSAMGPLEMLLNHGANIVAVDLDRDFIWNKLIKKARDGSGRVILPIKTDKLNGRDPSTLSDEDLAKIAGSNLLTDTPEIAQWLIGLDTGKSPMTIGNYTYLDGGLHVQLSIACDAIIDKLCAKRKDTRVAFLCTPTDAHPIVKEAHEDAKRRRAAQPWWQSLVHAISFGKVLKPNVEDPVGKDTYIVDGLVSAQGPNYALAKRLQHFRAIIAYDEGHIVASNVAPSTATKSVVHAATFAAAYGGMHNFPPMEVMYQETSNAVMGALLIHDTCSTKKRPADPASKMLKNPIELFKYGSFHGGVWRAASTIGSMGETCFILHYLGSYTLSILVSLAGAVFTGLWIAGAVEL